MAKTPEANKKTKSRTNKAIFNKRYLNMVNVYNNGWKSSHQDIKKYTAPLRGKFDLQPNDGKMIDHQTLLDDHAYKANRITSSGLNTGTTNKARRWFELDTDEELLEIDGVRHWLDDVEKRMYSVLAQSNMYQVFQSCYDEFANFGQGCYIILQDHENVIRGRSYTIGSYVLGVDSKGRKNAFGREFWMTVEQLVEEFGYENCSSQVQACWDNDDLEKYIRVRNIIEENDDRIPGFEDFSNMPYRSVYWEASEGSDGKGTDGGFLAKRGYKKFRVIAPSWEVVSTEQIYGYGLGWYALGNTKQLQKTVKDKLIAQEKLHNPPMQKDSSVTHTNLFPGGVSTTDSNVPNSGLRPAYQINPNLESFLATINDLKSAIDDTYFVPLFLMLMGDNRQNVTATEIAAREQEKMMMLGPVLSRMDEEMHTPTLEIVFDDMKEMGLIPPPPPELEGRDVKIKYVSILAQAQRALGIASIERVLGVAGMAEQIVPGSSIVLDMEQVIRETADMEGTPASIVKDKARVQAEKEAAIQAQQMAQQAEMANSAADTAQKMSSADMEGDNALTRVAQGVAETAQ